MQPRPAHYQLAHRLLPQDAHRPQGDTWPVIAGPDAPTYFAMQWDRVGGDPALAGELRIVAHQPIAHHHLIVVAMPTPMAATEAHFVAYAQPQNGGPLRYFVMEKGLHDAGEPERAFVSEYRAGGMRIRQDDLPAVSMEAFVGRLMQELSQPLPASGPVMGAPMTGGPMMGAPMSSVPSTSPMFVGPMHPPAPSGGGAGKWIALGVVGLLTLAGAGYFVSRSLERQAWLEQRKAKDAAAQEAKEENAASRKRAQTKLDEVSKPFAACVSAESEAAKKALELARSKRSLSGRAQRPKDPTLLTDALAFRLPTDKQPVMAAFGNKNPTGWIPVSSWVARTASTCPAPPAELASLRSELNAIAPSDYAYDREKTFDDHTERLGELVAALDKVATPKSNLPKTLVVADESCTSTVVAHYDSVPGQGYTPGGVDLHSYRCTSSLTWISLDGERVASASGTGAANPGRQPPTTTTADLHGIDRASLAEAKTLAADQLQKTVNTWGGGAK